MPATTSSSSRRVSRQPSGSTSRTKSRSTHLDSSDSDELSDDFDFGSPPPSAKSSLSRTASTASSAATSSRPTRAAASKPKPPPIVLPGDDSLSEVDDDLTDDELLAHTRPSAKPTTKGKADPATSASVVITLDDDDDKGNETESDLDVMDIDPRPPSRSSPSSASDSGLDAFTASAKSAPKQPSILIDLAPKSKSILARSATAPPSRPSTAKPPPSPSVTSPSKLRTASTPAASTSRSHSRRSAALASDLGSDSDFESAEVQLSNEVENLGLSDSDSDFESSSSKKTKAKPKPKAPAKRKSNDPSPPAATHTAPKRAKLSDGSPSSKSLSSATSSTLAHSVTASHAPAGVPESLAPAAGASLQRSTSGGGPTRSLGVGLSRAPLKPLGGGLSRTSSIGGRVGGGLGMRLAAPMPRPALGGKLIRSDSNSSSKSDSSDSGTGHRSALLELDSIAKSVSPAAIKPFKPPTFKKAPTGALGQHNPTLNRALGMRAGVKPPARPLHDPDAEGALVLWRPPELSEAEKMRLKEEDKQVAVVVDPTLSRVLRPHQIDGVAFMYQCVTGLKVPGVQGCIMADEMGLGKTLQCITLLWTLLRQSPSPGKPTVEKAIIVCPSSLVRNWANELIKWLGHNAIHPLCADNKGSKEENTKALQQFVSAKGRAIINPILIISYESLRLYSPILGQTPIGLMLCDEGHRLKNANSQTFVSLNGLNVPRRVILTGTPIQNDLTEYFSLLAFACPGMLGTESEFRKNFELPINRGRDADASDKEREIADQKLQELVAMASRVQIRRTQDLLRKYLPTKQEHVVFCKMAAEQLAMYQRYLDSSEVKALLRGKDSQPLKAIGYLKKLVNHPCLVDETRELRVHESGKLLVLDRMLHKIKTTTRDKIVLISNYTQTLDVFEKLCGTRGWGYLRLDGTMNVKKRQKLVDSFNDPTGGEFIFLLSSKAGGCGINLIGANRLVLFDPDWNPASDMQALARVWRDGQKKECFIYRFIATGTIEEKIFQRQCHKQMLSNCVVDEEQEVERHFSLENLRMLFQYNANTLSDTHDTFKCKRCVNNRQFRPPPRDNVSARNAATDMSLWHHYSEVEHSKVPDPMLRECGKDIVTFVFHNETQ